MSSSSSNSFAVFCRADLPAEVVHKWLSYANRPDDQRSPAHGKLLLIDPPEVALWQEGRDASARGLVPAWQRGQNYHTSIDKRADVNREWFLELDMQTSKDHASCKIVWRGADNVYVQTVRVMFDVAIEAIQALDQGVVGIVEMRNRSMCQGGILVTLEKPHVSASLASPVKEVHELRQARTPGADEPQDEDEIVPIFITADLPEDVLKKFVEKFDKPGAYYFPTNWMFINSFLVEDLLHAHSEGRSHKATATPFMGATADSIISFVRNNFVGWGICSQMFMMLDEHTPSGRGGLIGNMDTPYNMEGSDNWQLVRASLTASMLIMVSSSIAHSPIQETVDEAIDADGVVRMDPLDKGPVIA